MTLNDRLTRGLLAGMVAGFPSLAWGLFSKHVLHFTTLLYSDFAAILTYGKKAETISGQLFSQLVVFMFWGLGGIVFAYLVRYVTSKNLILKGFLWGAMVWFLSYVITVLYKVPGILIIPLKTAVSQLIGGLIWGGFLAVCFNYLDQKVKSGRS